MSDDIDDEFDGERRVELDDEFDGERRVELDYELDETVEATTPERLRAIADPLRSLLLDLVLERAMTVSELSARVGRPKGTVAHHVDLLVSVGLMKVVRTRRVRAIEERFYGRTARTVVFDQGARDELPFAREAQAEADFAGMQVESLGSGFTLRHARITRERAQEFVDRLMELALEFSREPRSGDVEHAMYVGVYATTRPVAPRPRIHRADI